MADKIQSLQKQYADLLKGSFRKNICESVDGALATATEPFGGSITSIVDQVLEKIRLGVLSDLGVSTPEEDLAPEVSITSIGVEDDLDDGAELGLKD